MDAFKVTRGEMFFSWVSYVCLIYVLICRAVHK